MPFTFRDKPKLADRLRGKSGEEILNELKSDLDPNRRMFFASPSWRTRHNNNNSGFPRGFPFDDDKNRTDIRAYLDEIAGRYPEFANQLKECHWGEGFDTSFKQKPKESDLEREKVTRKNPGETSTQLKESCHRLNNFGLRNTVPLGTGTPAEGERHQRSMSAPPDNRAADQPKKYVAKCEIPIMNDPKQESNPPMADLGGKGAQEPPLQKGNNSPNVRVIPIQVEGRDTPIVNANLDTGSNFGSENFRDSSFEGRLPRDFGTYQRHSPRFAHDEREQMPPQYQYAPQYQQYVPPPQQQFMPQYQFMPQQEFPPMQRKNQFASTQRKKQFFPGQQKQDFVHQQHSPKPPAPPPPQQQQPPSQQHPQNFKIPQAEKLDSKPPPQPKSELNRDVIDKVQVIQKIQKEVEELMKQVENFNGNSRLDKQYLMLDELLTRQLLLLDNIDTEGKDNVRQARKDAIQSIQRCISTLENKVPLPENNECVTAVSESKESETKDEKSEAMEVDQTKENTPIETKENVNVEVDNKENMESQHPPEELKPEQQPLQTQQQQTLLEENKKKP